jgi:hypothetical protein
MPDDPGEAEGKGQGRVERLPEIHDECGGKHFSQLSLHHIEGRHLSRQRRDGRAFSHAQQAVATGACRHDVTRHGSAPAKMRRSEKDYVASGGRRCANATMPPGYDLKSGA